MLTLVEETPLSDIPEEQLGIGIEALMLPDNTISNDGNDTKEDSQQVNTPCAIGYTITPSQGKGRLICFYMNVLNLTSQAINQFVMMCDAMVKEEDTLFVHMNSSLFCEDAETIYNAIYDCKAGKKIASAPYTLNTASFFPVMACDYLVSSEFMFSHFDTPSLRGGGNIKDAENSLNYDRYRKTRMLEMINKAGFIPDDAYEHIIKNQGSFTLYGEKFKQAADKFNQRSRE